MVISGQSPASLWAHAILDPLGLIVDAGHQPGSLQQPGQFHLAPVASPFAVAEGLCQLGFNVNQLCSFAHNQLDVFFQRSGVLGMLFFDGFYFLVILLNQLF